MIEKTPSFKTSDGNVYATLEIAQRAEMLKLLTPEGTTDISDTRLQQINTVLDAIFGRLGDVKEILRCTGRKARKSKNGATRKRKTVVKSEVGE